jgi:RNA polymerase sigma-70 factor (ECF subfamily)
VPAEERGVNDASTRRVVYCVVPNDLAGELYEPLKEFFGDNPDVTIVIDWRACERRREERRKRFAKPPGAERRRIQGESGRRLIDRRAATLRVASPALPPVVQPYAERLTFVERLEPSGRHAEDVDSARLVLAAQAGDPTAVSSLYLRYFDRLYTYLHVALRDSHDAEDIAQEAFLAMLGALPEYEVRLSQPFRVLLFRIARNRSIDHLRKHGAVDIEAPEELDRLRDVLSHDPPGAFDSLSDGELAAYVRRLPLKQRQVLMLRYALDFSAEEIGEVIGSTPQAVRNLQHRALRFLRRCLGNGENGEKLAGGRRMASVVVLRPAPVITGRQEALRQPFGTAACARRAW